MKAVLTVAMVAVMGLSAHGADASVPETLELAHLINRPDRWPASVTLKKHFRFGGGRIALKGQQVTVVQFRGVEVVVDAGNGLVFGLSPADCDLLEAANRFWHSLTNDQRAVEPQTLLEDASLWPKRVRCTAGFRLKDGTTLPPGGAYELVWVTHHGVRLYALQARAAVTARLSQTDAIQRARQRVLIAKQRRSARVADALRGVLVGSDGKPFERLQLDRVRIFALYYGASWCEPSRRFSPRLVEFTGRVGPANPHLAVVMISRDQDRSAMLSCMNNAQMPWPAVPNTALARSPLLAGYATGVTPQLLVVDRYGRVLANSVERGENQDPMTTVEALAEILETGVAKAESGS